MDGRRETVPGIATAKRFSALPRSFWRCEAVRRPTPKL